ncbi:MAG: CoA-binding protein [Promethearchaeota archaeon]
MKNHFLKEFLDPKSVAIYGANNTFGTTMGTIQLMNIISSGYNGKIYPIHLKLDNVMGHKAYKSIADVPAIPDLVIIVLPPKIVPKIFRECGEKGVKYLVVISGGFREAVGENMNNLTEEIVGIAKQYGMRFIGPNCFGFYNHWISSENGKVFNMMVFKEQEKRGKFSLASQSGTLTSHIFLDPEYSDLNIGKTISIGNEANIDIVDFLDFFKDDPETTAIGLYIEEIKRGKKFLELAKEISLKKPIIAIYGGGTGAGNRAIRSHTGSISGNEKIFDAMVKETGIIKTNYIQEFLNLAGILSRPNVILPRGNRLGIITNSGGPGAMIANNAENRGLLVPEFSKSLQDKLRSKVAPTASVNNPIDLTFDTNFFNFYLSYPKILMKSGEVDAIIMYGAIGFQEVWSNILKNDKIAPYLKIHNNNSNQSMSSLEELKNMNKIMIEPTNKLSQKYSIPIFYINPQNFASNWSKNTRDHGGIVFKLWDQPVDCLVKLYEYSKYLKNH